MNVHASDSYRLGIYAAAKHAGASHDEAVEFVRDLDIQAQRTNAFRLGAYKVARESGLPEPQAVALAQRAEKRAQWVGKLLHTATKIPTALGKGINRGAKRVVGGYGAASGGKAPAWMGKTVAAMGRHPGLVGGAALAAPAAGYMATRGGGEAEAQPDQAAEMRRLQAQLELMRMIALMQGGRGGMPMGF